MKILGISCGHDANICVLDEDRVQIHLEKERITRRKHDVGEVDALITLACEALHMSIEDFDLVATSVPVWPQYGSSVKIISGELHTTPFTHSEHVVEVMGKEIPGIFIPHHVGHMAYSFFLSGYDRADLISVDAYDGRFTATMLGTGSDLDVLPLRNMYPSNIGALWGILSERLFGGKGIFHAGKVMALAPFGEPRYTDMLKDRYLTYRDGFPIIGGLWNDSDHLPILDDSDKPLTYEHSVSKDMAASVQKITTEILLEYARALQVETGNRHLCLGGGVALNGLTNQRLATANLYDEVFIGPATNDAGLSIGFALYARHTVYRESRPIYADHIYLGKPYSHKAVARALGSFADQIRVETLGGESTALRAAEMLADGAVIAWYQGRGESGPRALGNRSILCDPRRIDGQAFLNSCVKHREGFRPYAPTILSAYKDDYFSSLSESPYMLKIAEVKPEHRARVPAIVHVDGSSRPQTLQSESNPLYFRLIERFAEITGIPMVLNTSFNLGGDPIVDSPFDALSSFLASPIDHLFLNGNLVSKR